MWIELVCDIQWEYEGDKPARINIELLRHVCIYFFKKSHDILCGIIFHLTFPELCFLNLVEMGFIQFNI